MKVGTRKRIIGPDLLPGADGANINGPSCIEVPAWVEQPLGRYYLYFAHHSGTYIRLAYADDPAGPWTIHQGGVLPVAAMTHCRDHIASPDAVIDEERREIRLYYHAVEAGGPRQLSYLATSPDGLDFVTATEPLAEFYLRVVRWRGRWVGMSKGGVTYLSDTGTGDFRRLRAPAFPMKDPGANAPGDVRHVALDLDGDRLWVLFTRIGDAPEHIRLGFVDLARPPAQWRVEADVRLLAPTEEWEGAKLPAVPSRMGAARRAENALRDPAVLHSKGKAWLFYACAGEQGIGLTPLPDLASWYSRASGAAQLAAADAPGPDERMRRALQALRQPGVLAATLAGLDRSVPRKRIFLMGCGRSGTWLLTSLMSCFDDVEVVTKELGVDWFALVQWSKPTVVLKRAWDSYRRVEAIPDSVRILHIVRHPFDVLTSHNPMNPSRFHIEPDRWLGEMAALRGLIEAADERLVVVRYEDLVEDADAELARIGAALGLSLAARPDEILLRANLPAGAAASMHGVRPIDRKSVARYRSDPEAPARLRAIVPELGETLEWVSRRFGYDIALP
jgi:hypothetical protein